VSALDALLTELLAPPAPELLVDLAAWRRHAPDDEAPFAAAVRGGLRSDRVAWAFASGYRAALRELLGAGPPRLRALCVTEAGGGHPRAITTSVAGGRLRGAKTYVTFGDQAEELLVLAREPGGAGARPRLGLYAIEVGRPGVVVSAGAGRTPFVPELPHGEARFEDVAVAPGDRLEGDGFADYARPFRTLEDIHVQGAVLAYLVAQGARLEASPEWTEDAIAVLAGLATAAAADPAAPATHRLLGGLERAVRRTVEDADAFWGRAPQDARARWIRDRALLSVAGKVRQARLAKARSR
jgi:acyl-CoA dehydrogenase